MFKVVVLTVIVGVACVQAYMFRHDPCQPNPCLYGGKCCRKLFTRYSCQCPSGYSGKNCQITPRVNPCDSGPCKNGGTCKCLGGYNYKCFCANGFKGRTCERSYNSDRCGGCLNGGTCTCDGGNKYVCRCKNGYMGRRCGKKGYY